MSRMGSNKRADIVRRQLDQAAAIEKQGFLASCQLVGTGRRGRGAGSGF
jgi:hypothetical protein